MSRRPLILMLLPACLLWAARGPQDPGPGGLEVGQPAPPLELEGLLQAPDGGAADWDRLRGNVVVVEFWGTWCAPCVAAIPHMNKLAEQFGDEDVRFISITFEDEKTIRRFLSKRPMKSWIGLDTDQSVVKAYDVRSWPTTVLVDRDGRVAAITSPYSVSGPVLEAMLAGRPPAVQDHPFSRSDPPNEAAQEPALYELSIHRTTSPNSSRSSGTGMLNLTGFPIIDVVSELYDVPKARIEPRTDLPPDRLDVRIVSPGGDPDLAVQKKLVAEQLSSIFGFTTRRVPMSVEVYVLTAPGALGENFVEAAGKAGSWTISSGAGRITATGVPLEQIVRLLETMLGRTVIDETDLSGYYDVSLEADLESHESIVESVRAQLGLVLSADRREIEKLVIEASDVADP